MFSDFGFRVDFRIAAGSGFKGSGFGFILEGRCWDFGFQISGLGLQISDCGFRVSDFGVWVLNSEFRVSDSGFEV